MTFILRRSPLSRCLFILRRLLLSRCLRLLRRLHCLRRSTRRRFPFPLFAPANVDASRTFEQGKKEKRSSLERSGSSERQNVERSNRAKENVAKEENRPPEAASVRRGGKRIASRRREERDGKRIASKTALFSLSARFCVATQGRTGKVKKRANGAIRGLPGAFKEKSFYPPAGFPSLSNRKLGLVVPFGPDAVKS